MSENEDKEIILLSSLPPFYEHFVDILLYERQSLAMQDVKEALSLIESSKKSKSKDDEGLTARWRFKKGDDWKDKKKGKSKSKNKTLKCFQCHKEGHFKIDCLEIKNQRKKGKDMNGDAAVVFDEQEDDYDSVGILVALSNQT